MAVAEGSFEITVGHRVVTRLKDRCSGSRALPQMQQNGILGHPIRSTCGNNVPRSLRAGRVGREGTTAVSSLADQQPEHPATGSAAVFGAALKARRNKTGRSLQALSQRVKLSTSTLSRYENGQCLPPEKHLATIFDALEVPNPERLNLLHELKQARADAPAARQTTSPAEQLPPIVGGTAIRRHWPNALRVTVIVVALVGLTTLGYLIIGKPADPRSDQSSLNSVPANCDRFTVASTHLALRDSYSAPVMQLPQHEALTVLRRSHPRGLPYWEVTTATNQQGWVDSRYLRPACR
jgi:transcriptional regulator with XRE-family HTH domain